MPQPARTSRLHRTAGSLLSIALALSLCAAEARAQSSPAGQTSTPEGAAAQQGIPQQTGTGAAAGLGQKDSGAQKGTPAGKDDTSRTKTASAGEEAASTVKLKLGPLDPSTAPTDLPKNRPVIGLALGGGGAIAMSEIGVLQWFEEHRIPVDVIAGTSMGSILAALYSTGHTIDQMKHILTEDSVSTVFRTSAPYTAQSFRRREDSRDTPNAITIGLKHGLSFRNALLTDNGLNELLDKEFLRYNDQTDFNNLPIPFRCQATDLNDAKTVTFSRGSLQDAVRASASIPGVFRPFTLNGHEYVDGAILENLPTADVKAMHADVILAVSLPLQPVGKGDLDSILGVLSRAFSVGIENNEARDRKLANVVIMPKIDGFSAADYLKTDALSARGYEAAEANKTALLQYSLPEDAWQQYLAHRASKQHGPPGTVLLVRVRAPDESVRKFAERSLAPLANQPFDTKEIEKRLSEIRSDGRYDADYTVGYDQAKPGEAPPDRPILLVTITDKKTGPPFLDVGFNLAAQTGGVTRATVGTTLHYQDLGGYGSELTAKVDFGFYTNVQLEYYRKREESGFFVAPRISLNRQPFYIYSGDTNTRLSERQLATEGAGVDIGWSDGRHQQLRAGLQYQYVGWTNTTGNDGRPDYHDNSQTARVQYIYDTQDRALVPSFGIRSVTSLGYLYDTPGSPSAPQLYSQFAVAHTFAKKNIVLANFEGGTMLNRDVAQPFRYTLGGPLRLAASAIDQYRGTDYFLITPGYLRRIHSLPAPLSSSAFVGAVYEVGQMRAPDGSTITRQDVYFGLIAETPLGVISLAPAIGNGGERKFVFTIGKLF